MGVEIADSRLFEGDVATLDRDAAVDQSVDAVEPVAGHCDGQTLGHRS